MTEGGAGTGDKMIFAFRLATARTPGDDELAILMQTYAKHLAEYQANVEAAQKLIRVGDSEPNESLNPSELAAWTMIANLLMNLDETVTKG